MYRIIILLSVLLGACSSQTQVRITSTPAGASVSEAGKGNLGLAPLQINFTREDCLDPDRCIASFYFSKEGYEGIRIEKQVKGPEILVHGYLKKIDTKLIVDGFPGFATVSSFFENQQGEWEKLLLSGKNSADLSLLDEGVWRGNDVCRVRLIIESPGYKPYEETIQVRRGEKKRFEYVLQEYALSGQINSEPTGVDVYERNLGYLGRTPFQLRLPYDQLVRISPQRSIKLEEPVYLFLTFKKNGFENLSIEESVGELHESEDPEPFKIFRKLYPVNLNR